MKPSPHQLAILESYARTRSYRETAAEFSLSPHTITSILKIVRVRYGTPTSVEAYGEAVAAGDIPKHCR